MTNKNTLKRLIFSLLAMTSTCVLADVRELHAFVYPVLAPKKTSSFGDRVHPVLKYKKHHDGVDLAAPNGAVIRAIRDGRVVFADPHGTYGNYISIDHGDKITSHYGHCQSIRVKPGEKVIAGQIIGTVGQTGRVTGPHLHFEVRRDGKALDPEKYLPALNTEAAG